MDVKLYSHFNTIFGMMEKMLILCIFSACMLYP